MQLQSIKSIKKLGVQKTLDFEVNHKDHNFYAEGIVVSNSHSLCVSKLGAFTVWAKYKYPLQFYTACLNMTKQMPNPIEEISLIEKELPYFDIKLLPPHVLKSREQFIIEDKNIRFSLQSIKGISDKTLEKLKNFCHSYSNKFEIFSAANEVGLNVAATSNIIAVGAMDDFLTNESRANTILELNLYNLLTSREQERVIEMGKDFNYNLVQIIKYLSKPQDGSEKPFIKESRLETLRRNFEPYHKIYQQNSKNEELLNWRNEKIYLGFSYSYKLFDILKKIHPDIESLNECAGELNDTKILIGGEIIEYKLGTSKNKNKYIKIKLNDDSGKSYDAMLMEKYFEINNELNDGKNIEIGNIVMVYGRKSNDIVFADKIINQNINIIQKKSQLKEQKNIDK